MNESSDAPVGVEVNLVAAAWKHGFMVLLPGVPRVGEHLTFAVPHRRGQGRYVVSRVEWFYRGLGWRGSGPSRAGYAVISRRASSERLSCDPISATPTRRPST
jgi:hypothetical protein